MQVKLGIYLKYVFIKQRLNNEKKMVWSTINISAQVNKALVKVDQKDFAN